MEETLAKLGIHLPDLIAGIGGGVVNAVVLKRAHPLAFIGSVVVGAIMANYLGPHAAKYLGTAALIGSFLVGVTGIVLCQSIIAAAGKWRPTIGGGGNAQ